MRPSNHHRSPLLSIPLNIPSFTLMPSNIPSMNSKNALRELQSMVNQTTSINKHLLLGAGAPRSISSEPWLRQSNWLPFKLVSLPPGIRSFRFAGHWMYGIPIHDLYAVCLSAELTCNANCPVANGGTRGSTEPYSSYPEKDKLGRATREILETSRIERLEQLGEMKKKGRGQGEYRSSSQFSGGRYLWTLGSLNRT